MTRRREGFDSRKVPEEKGFGTMLAESLKAKINLIWQTLWSAGLTNPIKDVEQITYLMFMKLLDEQQILSEQKSNLLGVELSTGVFAKADEALRWSRFKNKAPDEMYKLVRDKVFPFIKTIDLDKTGRFPEYMRDSVFEIPNAKTLAAIVAEMDALDMSNMDAMGDVYEELINCVKTSGTNGQFRTPREIINLIIELVQPTLDDRIIDPAMGTAGFLTSAALYLHRHYAKELTKTSNVKRYKTTMFTGRDTDPSMLRIGAMNLLLNGVESPDLSGQNSIEVDSLKRGEYTLVVANPPFTGNMTNVDVAKDLSAIASTNKTELLFMALFTKLLKIGGRCASIVPQGVLFGSSNAHKSLRKEIIENQKLEAVINLPSGVFQPYSGVATAIVIFTKTDRGGTENVWFHDVKAVGYSLDQKTQQIKENDIPEVIKRYHARDAKRDTDRKSAAFFVPKAEIVENGYDLSFNKYREVEVVKEVLPSVKELVAKIEKLTKEFETSFAALRGAM